MSKSVLIVYTTVGGNTQLVVEKVAEVLSQKEVQITFQRVEKTQMEDLDNFQNIILACPTYGQGTVEAGFKPFLKNLKKKDLSGKIGGIIGLGDIKYYPHYLTEASSILTETFEKTGIEIPTQPMRIGKNPVSILDSLVIRWAEKFAEVLK